MLHGAPTQQPPSLLLTLLQHISQGLLILPKDLHQPRDGHGRKFADRCQKTPIDTSEVIPGGSSPTSIIDNFVISHSSFLKIYVWYSLLMTLSTWNSSTSLSNQVQTSFSPPLSAAIFRGLPLLTPTKSV